ncbi:hypothetical protein PF66_01747 [Pseudomonas asplenii]|uniref:Uncharacterized protein n=1 Tax=Pseudomonas asplenii TaxID=53407 RepID=A0A0M9GI23_9PSED|nr:hypothetical protein PF66_01747 [Pseudomonas fuscovaginae]
MRPVQWAPADGNWDRELRELRELGLRELGRIYFLGLRK